MKLETGSAYDNRVSVIMKTTSKAHRIGLNARLAKPQTNTKKPSDRKSRAVPDVVGRLSGVPDSCAEDTMGRLCRTQVSGYFVELEY